MQSKLSQFCTKMKRLREAAWPLPWTNIEIGDIEHGDDVVSAARVDAEFILAAVNASEAMERAVRAAETVWHTQQRGEYDYRVPNLSLRCGPRSRLAVVARTLAPNVEWAELRAALDALTEGDDDA